MLCVICPEDVGPRINANGPAIWGGCVTRRQHRAGSWYFSHKTVTVQGGYGTCFCRHGTNFIEHYECRGTNLIGAANLSPVTILVAGTGAVSRYNLSRSQELVKVQDFNYEQMRVSGCKNHYKFVLGAGAKAKTVTNNLPILSVLGFRAVIFILILNFFPFLMCKSIGSSTGSVSHYETKIMV